AETVRAPLPRDSVPAIAPLTPLPGLSATPPLSDAGSPSTTPTSSSTATTAPSPTTTGTDQAAAIQYDDPDMAALPAPEDNAMPLPVVAPTPMTHSLDPAQAAFEAARIAEQIVGGSFDTASGAAIVAAAAAGAAIEAARIRAFSGESSVETSPMPAEGTSNDPVVTVRMQRERVLRALAGEVAANATTQANAEHQQQLAANAAVGGTEARTRAPSQPGYPHGPTTPGDTGEEGYEEGLDPVQIAAAAIQRLRARASTDFAELRGHYQRHDLAVLVLAFVIIVVAGRVHRSLVTPPNVKFAVRGLQFAHTQSWLAPEDLPTPPPRIIRDPGGQPPKRGEAYHVAFTSSIDPNARIEVLIDKKPAWSNIVTGLELDRRTRYGELYTLDDSSIRSIVDQDWLRTAYRYAHAVEKGDEPRVDRAIEYATIDREQLYVVTLFGSAAQLARMEEVIAPTLRVPTRSGLPLVPQTRSFGQRTYPNQVARAFDSTVMVVVADLVDGRLRARGGGSGVIVGADGSILTNYHVIHDKDGRLHDVFVIGRFSTLDRAPQLQCAGRPSRSKLQRELDLALIKCDLDLDGRTWQPATGGIWATLPEVKTADVKMGQRVWVLGYPDAGGGGLTLSEGAVEGWTGQDGTSGNDFLKTDASITHGNSGGPVIDDSGRLVGIAAASRTRVSASGNVVEMSQIGLVRPLPTASDLLAIAAAGWRPREGHTDVELQPSAVEAPAEGVRIATRILDAANEAPIRDALVMVLRPGVNSGSIDVNRLDDQVLSWGRSNTGGEVQLKQPVPVPGTYTVMVVAHGYEPLIGEGALKLDAKTPPAFDPWGQIKLLAR
ncbi:MAG: trypsin-like peptidase domain-containing protein, partial [Deltaproteobacteria bacterium]|nr:trypsin-like peptidase domain-containing protein [Deltaproteobacteria bacterium]